MMITLLNDLVFIRTIYCGLLFILCKEVIVQEKLSKCLLWIHIFCVALKLIMFWMLQMPNLIKRTQCVLFSIET